MKDAQTRSSWMTTAEMPSRSPLQDNIDVDVCIVGAGIAGMTTAYLLASEGLSVAVLDDGPVGGGMTGRTTAHLVNALDDRYFELERLHGARGALLAAESHTEAIDLIEKIVRRESIDCNFERVEGYLFVPPGEPKDILDDELAAGWRAGLRLEKVDRAPLDYDTGPALRFPDQAQFHPIKYLAGLARAIEQKGGRIFTESHATDFEGGEDAHVTTTNGGTVSARSIVIATNTPVNDLFAIHTKQAPYQTYVIAARIPRGSVKKALYWDTPNPYHYARIQELDEMSDLLIVGGEDHKTGQEDDADRRFGALEQWTRARFPRIESIDYRWSGEVMEPVDGLAFIGRNPLDKDNVYIATGDSGNGMTHGTIAGVLLTDLIQGRENEWETLYEPSRKTLRALPVFLKENLNVAAQFVDLITPGEVESVDSIKRGSGAVVRRGLLKIAAYKDESGKVHERSAVCRHLGCIVGWNSLENSWDCPCHGSRYDAMGKVIQGPANSDLPEVETEKTNARAAVQSDITGSVGHQFQSDTKKEESSMSTNSNDLPMNEVNETPEKQINIGEIERLASGIAGGALTIIGLRRRSIAGLGLTLAGTALLHRGVSGHCNIYELAGIGTNSVSGEVPVAKDVHVEKSIVIDKSPEELYRFWREFENLPRFMEHLESVTCTGLNRSHWIAKGPAGKNVQWDAEIYNDKPGEMIAWRSLEGSEIVNAGSVRFTALGERGTEVKVVLNYNVPGGKVSALLAKLLGREPGQMIADDLRRLKQILETGEVATTEGQPSGRDPEAVPYKAVAATPRETPAKQPAKSRAASGGA